VVVKWPHKYLKEETDAGRVDGRTVICVLTHDPKFDVPVLELALRLPGVAYIGAMGSRRTHDDRLERLRAVGVTEEELARLSSPIGLDLGARTPEETAVSIAAEIVARRWGGTGDPLTTTDGRIHAHAAPADFPADVSGGS
jgi:xanthine dehydrogenase accessory factor